MLNETKDMAPKKSLVSLKLWMENMKSEKEMHCQSISIEQDITNY